MMNEADVLVTVQGGVASVDVRKTDTVVEVRDYDVDGVDDAEIWTDENGDRCVRYFVTDDNEERAAP
jgi:hypothetical protein